MNQILFAGALENLIEQEKIDIKILKPDKKIKLQNKETKKDKLEENIINNIDEIKKQINDVKITEQTNQAIARAEKNKKQKKTHIEGNNQTIKKEKIILGEKQNLEERKECNKKQIIKEPLIKSEKNNERDNVAAIKLEREKSKLNKKKNSKVIKTKKRIKTVNIKVIPVLIILLLIITMSIGVPKVYSSLKNNTKNSEEIKVAVDENSSEEKKEPIEEEKSEVETHVASDGNEYHTLGIVEVPSLDIKYPILAETTDELLKVSVTKYWGANPNQVGNLVIVGHNYKNTQMFSKLTDLENGDVIKITDNDKKTLEYKVYDMKKIDPYDNDCTSQKTKGRTEVTLITCADNGSNRYYVKARAN